MKLHPKHTIVKATWPVAREEIAVVEKLQFVANTNGLTLSEALSQLLVGYFEQPFTLNKRTDTENKSGVYPPLQLDAHVVEFVRQNALAQKISQAEALRQIVRKFLKTEGHL